MKSLKHKLNLSDYEEKDGERKELEYQWHPTKTCEDCGDRMFWHAPWKKWLCRTWIYMEGGC